MELIVKNVVVIRCHGDAKGNGFAICGSFFAVPSSAPPARLLALAR